MKRVLLILSLVLIASTSFAQPSSEIFPDFTFEDLDGTEHNLQTYLDQGKTVVIDVFATWCTNCQNSVGGLEDLYNTHGQAGDNTMVVLSFERDPSTNNEAAYAIEHGVESPIIKDATQLIADEWNITYQPRYFVVCPDGTFQSELVTPIYNNPQPLIDLADECEMTTGLNTSSLEDGFSIINSTFDNSIRYTNDIGQVTFTLLNLTGGIVEEGVLKAGTGSIELNTLPKGLYLIRLSDGQTAITKRLVKRL